jgi:hypothetical protein
LTFSVIGTVNDAGRLEEDDVVFVSPELIVIVPVYVPGASDVGSMRTVTLLGVVPVFGAMNSHAVLPVFEAVARKLRGVTPSVLVIEI